MKVGREELGQAAESELHVWAGGRGMITTLAHARRK
jgi:hypothetical protein